jgi:hypothetical protein
VVVSQSEGLTHTFIFFPILYSDDHWIGSVHMNNRYSKEHEEILNLLPDIKRVLDRALAEEGSRTKAQKRFSIKLN